MRALKVLILEDSPFQMMAIHQMLNACGVFDVLTAESVDAARQSLENRGPVDIAICDLQMEGPGGLELIGHLSESGQARAVVILSSAEASVLDHAVQFARQKGLWVLAALSKPASCSVLHQLLMTFVDNILPLEPALPVAEVRELVNTGDLSEYRLQDLLQQWVPYYQPQVGLEGGLLSAQAQVRWQHPELGLLSASSFMPLVEFAGLSEPLTWHLLDHALALSARIRAFEGRALSVMVDVLPVMHEQDDFYLRVHERIARCSLPAGILVLQGGGGRASSNASTVRAARRAAQGYRIATPMTADEFTEWYLEHENIQIPAN